MNRTAIGVAVLLTLQLRFASAQDLGFLPQLEFAARDSLNISDEPIPDARECLHGLAWSPSKFLVTCRAPKPNRGDASVRFASPISTKDERRDLVAMEWYLAKDADQRPIKAPAVVVVHELDRRMVVGRLFANGLRKRGLHTFLIHLPLYGERRSEENRLSASNLFTVVRQAITDVRRARDAVAVLPYVDSSHIAVQGTSLGGFIASATAGLDAGYNSVFLVLSGGDLYNLILNGKRDTAKIRTRLQIAGITGQKLKRLVSAIEPTRIAHRFRPARTWLYSGRFDTVVPMVNSLALASAARLSPEHHIRMAANHYTGIVFLPFVFKHIDQRIRRLANGEPEN